MQRIMSTHHSRGIPLGPLIVIAIVFTFLVLGALGTFFVWLQFGQLRVELSQSQVFGVVRNTVTAGAALGLGATLALTYRKQKTTERAQETAAGNLEVTQISLGDTKEENLRSRYVTAVDLLSKESITSALAGVSSLIELADDWGKAGNPAAVSSIIRLLSLEARRAGMQGGGSYYNSLHEEIVKRLQERGEGSNQWREGRHELRVEPFEVLFDMTEEHLVIEGLQVSGGGQLSIYGETSVFTAHLKGIHLNDGAFRMSKIETNILEMYVENCQFLKGSLAFDSSFKRDVEEFNFKNCIFGGIDFDFICLITEPPVTFENCVFLDDCRIGKWHFHPSKAFFVDCEFKSSETIPQVWDFDDKYSFRNVTVEGGFYMNSHILFADNELKFGPHWAYDEIQP